MINIERLTPDGWQQSTSETNIHSAVNLAKELCAQEPSTYRLLRNDELICLVRKQGIIWINANSDVMGSNHVEKTKVISHTKTQSAEHYVH